MGSVGEWMQRQREALRSGTNPSPGPPVLLEAASGVEVLLPKPDEPPPVHPWRTRRIRRDEIDPAQHEKGRIERMLALQGLISSDSQIFVLQKGDGNPAPHVCIGRAKRNDVVLADDTISSLHAYCEDLGDGMVLVDQGSSNGTFVNQRRLTPNTEVRLFSGDCVRFGGRVLYYLTGERLLLFLELRIVKSRESS